MSNGVLRIIRRKRFVDALRSYSVSVNRAPAGRIRDGEVLTLELPAGEALVEAHIDWCGSEPIRVLVEPDKVTQIEVSNNWGALLSIIAITFGRGSYLRLRPVT